LVDDDAEFVEFNKTMLEVVEKAVYPIGAFPAAPTFFEKK